MIDFQSKFNEAWVLRNSGDYKQVDALIDKYLPLTQKTNDKASEALFLKLKAQLHSDKNEIKESLKYYKQIERLYIELGDQTKQMNTLRHIGSAYYELKEYECAQKCLVQVVDAYASNSPNPLELANSHRAYALVMKSQGSISDSIFHWEKARELYKNLCIEESVQECDNHLGTTQKE